jgi:hypothetical protein
MTESTERVQAVWDELREAIDELRPTSFHHIDGLTDDEEEAGLRLWITSRAIERDEQMKRVEVYAFLVKHAPGHRLLTRRSIDSRSRS